MTDQTRNLIIMAVIGVAILIGWQYIHPAGVAPPPAEKAQEAGATAPAASKAEQPAFVPISRDEALAQSARLAIDAKRIEGSISLTGARIDDIELRDYRATNEPDSPKVSLLSPSGTKNAYFSEFGWLASDPSIVLPDADSVWQASQRKLTTDSPVTLSWDNGHGLTFTRRIEIDENYMFTITRRVENHGTEAFDLWPYGLIARYGTGPLGTLPYATYLVHEGALGVLNGTLEELGYDDMRDEKEVRIESTGGWIGITDKYWLVALAPKQDNPLLAGFSYSRRGELDKYQVDLREDAMHVAPGGALEVTDRLFVGAKEYNLLENYEDAYGIPRLTGSVKFFLWFLAKPLFYALDFFYRLFGNFGVAILTLTICVRLLLFPLANKSYKAMSKMKKLHPQITKLRERHKDDRQRLNKEMMELYKREKVNPMAGCLPIVLQIPIFFALYNVLFVSIEMRHAPFFGWITDLSARDPYSVFTLFGLIPYDLPQWLVIGPWPLFMGLTMWLQFKLNPTPPEPIQAKIMTFLPIIFTFILAPFPAGLVIYWTWNNTLSITQQWIIMRRMGVKVSFGGKKS